MPTMGGKVEDPSTGKVSAFLSFLPAMSPSHREPNNYFTSVQVIENYPGVREIKDWSPAGTIVRQALCCAFNKGSYRSNHLIHQ